MKQRSAIQHMGLVCFSYIFYLHAKVKPLNVALGEVLRPEFNNRGGWSKNVLGGKVFEKLISGGGGRSITGTQEWRKFSNRLPGVYLQMRIFRWGYCSLIRNSKENASCGYYMRTITE